MKKLILALLVVCSMFAPTLAIDMSSEINTAAKNVLPQVIEWRRYIHQHPELSNREFNTSKLVADKLKEFGIEVRTGIAHTGVVGILKGGKPGPVVGLRADMDALPVTERTDVPFKSTVTADYDGHTVGVMHACGHDSHVAMLLGTAKVLSSMRDKVPGTVVFIFQPSEEGAPAGEEGGAELMVKEGVMDNPKIDAVFGIHINAQTEIGKIARPKNVWIVPDMPKTRSGKIMRRVIAAVSNFTDVGDVTTLANPEVVDGIRRQVRAAKAAKGDVPRELTETEKAEIKAFGTES